MKNLEIGKILSLVPMIKSSMATSLTGVMWLMQLWNRLEDGGQLLKLIRPITLLAGNNFINL